MSHTPLRILIVHNTYKIPGGEDSVVANETAMLQNAGCHVVSYHRSNTELDSYSMFQKLLLPFRSIYARRTYKDIKKLIQTEHIDLVHVHNTLSVISPSVYYAALACHVPVLQTIHNYRLLCPGAMLLRDGHICTDCIEKGLSQSIRYKCYRGSKLQTLISSMILRYHRMRGVYHRISYLCLTDFNKQILLRLNQPSSHNKKKKELIDPDRIYIKPNFTKDPGKMIPYEKRSARFLYVSRMECAKGIFVLLDAWKQYEQAYTMAATGNQPVALSSLPQIKELFLCGSGPEETQVKQRIAEYGLQHVHFVGQLPHEELLDLMADSLAVCMPTQWYEGFPVTIVESYACGTPVIASALGNTGTLIRNNITGYTHPPADASALAKLLLQWEQPAHTQTSLHARQEYEAHYTECSNLAQLLAIYERVLDS